MSKNKFDMNTAFEETLIGNLRFAVKKMQDAIELHKLLTKPPKGRYTAILLLMCKQFIRHVTPMLDANDTKE